MTTSLREYATFRRAPILFFCSITLILILCTAASLLAQGRGNDQDYDDQSGNGASAGGNWTMFQSEDRMTAQKRTRFVLPANDSRDRDDRAQVMLFCVDGKLKLADFRPNVKLSRPNWGGFWGQPQMRVRVRAGNWHDEQSWNWVNGHFLSMDKGTTRHMIGAGLFRIEFNTPEGARIAEFSPEGLDLRLVHEACDLTPKK